MIVYSQEEYPQGELAWMCLRAGVVTASEMNQIITPKFAKRDGKMWRTYLAAKVAERWQNGPLPAFGSWATDQGKIVESEARAHFEFERKADIQRVGFVTSDDGRVGCSPDGLLGEDRGIEIKCPEAKAHCKMILSGEVPDEYIVQVYASMWVTGRPSWTFYSYKRNFPAFLIEVEHDAEIEDKLAEAVSEFLADLDDAYSILEKAEGGPNPNKRITAEQFKKILQEESPAFVPDENVPLN